MAGYYGFSMSNNAVAAYESGEMPISKWRKATILDHCGDKAAMLSKLTVTELRSELLVYTGWHHTSKQYNRTEFYGFDEDALETMTAEKIAEIIAVRAPRERSPKAEPETITAEISYTVWEGSLRHPRPREMRETVTFRAGDKMISTTYGGRKRMTSITVLRRVTA